MKLQIAAFQKNRIIKEGRFIVYSYINFILLINFIYGWVRFYNLIFKNLFFFIFFLVEIEKNVAEGNRLRKLQMNQLKAKEDAKRNSDCGLHAINEKWVGTKIFPRSFMWSKNEFN